MGPKWVKIGRFRGPKSWIWDDESMTNMTFGGPDPQIDGFGPLLGSKSGGPRLTGLAKSLSTVVQPVRWDPRRGQNPSKIVTKMGDFGGPDPQIMSLSCFGHMDLTKSGGSDPQK